MIEGARYDMKLFHSPNGQQIRTFYPIFKGAADPADGVERDPVTNNLLVSDDEIGFITETNYVRIISVMVNQRGDDVGFERMTLVNISPEEMTTTNWSLRTKTTVAM